MTYDATFAMSSSERRPPKAGMAPLPLVTCFITAFSLKPPSRYSSRACEHELRGLQNENDASGVGEGVTRDPGARGGERVRSGSEYLHFRRKVGHGAHILLERLLRHDDVLAASVARSAVSGEHGLARSRVAREGRRCNERKRRRSTRNRDLGVRDLGDRRVESEGSSDGGEHLQQSSSRL